MRQRRRLLNLCSKESAQAHLAIETHSRAPMAMAMEFLQGVPSTNLVDEGKWYSTFVAEIFDERPSPEEIYNFKDCAGAMQKEFESKAAKKTNIRSIALYVDKAGCFCTICFAQPKQTSDAQKAAKVMLSGVLAMLPPERRCKVLGCIRPCDELDKDRFTAMRTIQGCMPESAKRSRSVEEDEEDNDDIAHRSPKPVAELLAEASSCDTSSDEGQPESRLCVRPPSALQVYQPQQTVNVEALSCSQSAAGTREHLQEEVEQATTEMRAKCGHNFWSRVQGHASTVKGGVVCSACGCKVELLFKCGDCGMFACDPCRITRSTAERDACVSTRDAALRKLHEFDAHTAWAELAKHTATIKIASAGQQDITYVRIYKPERRVEFISKRLPANADLVMAARVAKQLVDEGVLKCDLKKRAHKSEFINCFTEALRRANPSAETDPKQLPMQKQHGFALVLDGTLRFCHHCGKEARDPVCLKHLGLTIEWTLQPVCPEVLDGKFACHTCAENTRLRLCTKCAKDDALEATHNELLMCTRCSVPMAAAGRPCIVCGKMDALETTVREFLKCTRCNEPVVGMLTLQERREKRSPVGPSLLHFDLQIAKRMRLEAGPTSWTSYEAAVKRHEGDE